MGEAVQIKSCERIDYIQFYPLEHNYGGTWPQKVWLVLLDPYLHFDTPVYF